MLFDVATWGVTGAAVQALAQGLRQKPLNYKPAGYAYSSLAFIGIGLLLNGVRASQRDFVDRRVAALAQQRASRGVEFERTD